MTCVVLINHEMVFFVTNFTYFSVSIMRVKDKQAMEQE